MVFFILSITTTLCFAQYMPMINAWGGDTFDRAKWVCRLLYFGKWEA